MTTSTHDIAKRRVVVVGGGYAGLTAARRLRRKLPHDTELVLVNPHAYMTYQPLLPETAAGTVSPSHVVVPLREALQGVRVLTGSMTGLDRHARRVAVTGPEGKTQDIAYDELVLAAGSVTRILPVPGLVEHAIGFRTVEEALHLGNRVLSRLDLAASTDDPAVRRKALTFVVIGAGFAGVEALAEVEDMVRRTLRRHPTLRHEETRWVLVEAGARILGQLPERLASYVRANLEARGIEVRTDSWVEEIVDGELRFGDGTRLSADTVVWTAGVVASPFLRRLDLTVDRLGRVVTDDRLRVTEGVWALGDCAAVPDLENGGYCAPTAQHAVRQARQVADNVVATVRGRATRGYRHRDAGAVASLGLRQGVAELYGVPLRGYPAWVVHRLYHGSRLPCPRRRFLVVLNWLLGSLGRVTVALPALESPRAPLQEAHADQIA